MLYDAASPYDDGSFASGDYDSRADPRHDPRYDQRSDQRSDPRYASFQDEINRLVAQNEEQNRKISVLQVNLDKEAQTTRMIKESANKMAQAMESKDLFVGRQDSDDVVYSRFQLLLGQIKTWSIPFAQERHPNQLKLAIDIEDFRKVVPAVTDMSRFLANTKNMRLFVRGFVSLTMAETLFRTLPYEFHPGTRGEDVWMDQDLARGVSVIETRLFNAGKRSTQL